MAALPPGALSALCAGAVGVLVLGLGLVLGLRIGWRACARHARLEWDGPGSELDEGPGEITGPIVVTDLRAAAALPGPMPAPPARAYSPDPARVRDDIEWVCRPGPEYRAAYARVWTDRPARVAAIDQLVELIAVRVATYHELRGGMLTERGTGDGHPGA